MATNNTAFSPNADFVAQITGSGALLGGPISPAYVAAGNTDVTAVLQVSRNILITTATGNSTVIFSGRLPAGALVTIQINNDAGGARTVTLGTGFRPTATVVGTASRAFVLIFISDGLTLNEASRSASALV